jgi:hypothetical protein
VQYFFSLSFDPIKIPLEGLFILPIGTSLLKGLNSLFILRVGNNLHRIGGVQVHSTIGALRANPP